MAFIDYYKIMGIPKETPQSEIRKAYLKRTKLFHPDLHPDDPKAKAKFQALNEAYAVLSDPDKRAKYDKYGAEWQQADAYEQAARNAQAGGGPGGGFSFHTSGGDDEGFDFSQFGGTGGFSSFFEDLFGAAAARRGGRRTSMHFNVDPAQYDANATVTIDMYTAMLGGDILLQTQSGKLKLKVKPETQNGAKIRLRGKGYQKPDGTYGNLIITYNVKLPTGLTEHQRQLLQEMRDEQVHA